MSLFKTLLIEALSDKPFDTIKDLLVAIKNTLNSYSRIHKGEENSFSKLGFKFRPYKREYRIKVTGDEPHMLIADLKKANIHVRYSSINDMLVIRFEDNVKPDGLLSDNTKKEIETGKFNVIGTVVDHMSDINFNPTQQAIYNELEKYNKAHWIEIESKKGLSKLKYTLKDSEI